jgi:hypothetical protein
MHVERLTGSEEQCPIEATRAVFSESLLPGDDVGGKIATVGLEDRYASIGLDLTFWKQLLRAAVLASFRWDRSVQVIMLLGWFRRHRDVIRA